MQGMIGRTLGKYRVVQLLGRGGMAEVYKAHQINLDRYVAIKLMHAHLAADPQFVERFEREAKNIAALRHPNIVQVFDFDLIDDLSYIVMEFIEGLTLKAYVEQRKRRREVLSLEEAVRIVTEIGNALAYAHQRDMIHRDVKPANVMVDLSKRIILTDFGLAKILSQPSHTASGATVGTPAYMAPEQGLGKPGDPRTDIYALSVILYELTTGRAPFQANTPVAIMMKHLKEAALPPRSINPDLPEFIERVILTGLAKRPEERFQSMQAMLAALERPTTETDVLPTAPISISPDLPQAPITELPEVISPPEPTLPPTIEEFVGREAELAYFTGQLKQGHLAIISGMPGAGKTTLAAVLAQQVREPTQTYWHSFHAGEGVNVLIWKLAGFLAWRGQPELWQMLQGAQQGGSQPPPAEVLFDYLFQMLCGRDYLLCFDNFHFVEDDPQLAQFVERLEAAVEAGDLSILIISSRRLPAFARSDEFKPLAGLSLEDTRLLLEQRGLSLQEGWIETLYASTAGNAQLLTLAVEALRRTKDPGRMINRLSESESIEKFLVKTVDESLNAGEREVMSAVAVLMDHAGSREAISAILHGRSVRLRVNDLANRYLLHMAEGEAGKEYSQNPIVREFYYDLLSKREQQDMHHRAGEFYTAEEPDSLRAARHFLRAGEDHRAIQLISEQVWTIINQGQARLLRQVLEEISQKQLEERQKVEVDLARGQVYALLGETQAARACYEGVHTLFSRQPDSEEVCVMRARACLGMGELLQEDAPHEALEWLHRGLEEVKDCTVIEEAALRIRIGRILAFMGDFEEAESELQHGLDALPPGASRMRITALGNLGNIYCIRGDSQRGQDYYQQVLDIAQQMNDFWSMIEVEHTLGIELAISGRWAEALEQFQDGLEQAERIGSLDQQIKARLELGMLYIMMGDHAAAEQNLTECLEMARRAGYQHYLIYAQPSLADLYLRQGKLEAAVPLLSEAEALALETGGGQAEALPEIYRNWALLWLGRGDPDTAQDYVNRSLDLAREMGVETEAGMGLRVLGEIQLARGQPQEALRSYEQSLAYLEQRDPYEAARTRLAWGLALRSEGQTEAGNSLLSTARATFEALGARGDLESSGIK